MPDLHPPQPIALRETGSNVKATQRSKALLLDVSLRKTFIRAGNFIPAAYYGFATGRRQDCQARKRHCPFSKRQTDR